MKILQEGIAVSIFAMVIVFFVLIAIMFIIKIQSRILGVSDKENQRKEEKNIKAETVKLNDNSSEVSRIITHAESDVSRSNTKDNKEEVVAAIIAALMLYGEENNVQFKIKSIRRIDGDSAWAQANLL
ncbi:OadG family protein [Clostridium polynesiense]|uniref:OadG family protein n=1 Tax=Clostridium polynesiense TaxID=1325933 RepID=UPI00058F5322|nr:OadG family protein [Clostridium polynesiense]